MKSKENNQVKSDRAVKVVIIETYDPALISVVDEVPVRTISSNAAAVKVIAIPYYLK